MLPILGTPSWFAHGCENAAGKFSRGGKQLLFTNFTKPRASHKGAPVEGIASLYRMTHKIDKNVVWSHFLDVNCLVISYLES